VEIAVSHFRSAPPWRRIAIVIGVIAAVELVLLVVAGVSLIAKPVQSSVQHAAAQQVAATPAETARVQAATRHAAVLKAQAAAKARAKAVATRRAAAARKPAVVAPALVGAGTPKRARTATAVLVLNGVGTPGAAGRTAARVAAKGYRIDGVTNAARTGYTRTTIMYRPGFRAEAARLGKDMGVPLVGPLDGMRPADLGRAQLVVIVGA
jgi:hypothetical protein